MSNMPYSGRSQRDLPRRPRSPRFGGDGRSSGSGPRGDSYRSLSSNYRPPPPPSHSGDGYPPQNVYYPPPPGYDSFQPPQGDFTFRSQKPAGVQDSHPGGRSGGEQRFDRRNTRNNDRSSRAGRGGPLFRGGYNKRLAADRPILNATHTSSQELSYADSATGVTYRAFEDLSDSDEAEMDMSEDETPHEQAAVGGAPALKKARTNTGANAGGNQAPKWCNPDPYTATPPPDTTQQKKKDVVHLIRKARVKAAEGVQSAMPDNAADFISCALSDDEEEAATPIIPGHKSSTRNTHIASSDSRSGPLSRPQDSLPSQPLGNRKRTRDDEIKLPDHARLKRHTTKMVDGYLTEEWQPVKGRDSCPWFNGDAASPGPVASLLHREIADFYEYVKPRDFEQRIRQGLVDELDNCLRRSFRDATVYPFGSFMSCLYLPTGDMDLAFCSDSYIKGGMALYGNKKSIFRMSSYLSQRKFARDNHIETVVKAKVPLVKYVDARTGLKVDISFENTTGVTAIKTFTDWRDQYPAMPILATLVKHFLAMRGLNEPANGGIGGFSVVCLVVSMLQLSPTIQGRAQAGEHILNELLMEFFDLYGNKFNYEKLAISVNPPKYIAKSRVESFAYKNYDRLSIIDPNNPENDISGGSSNTVRVVSAFSEAHRLLQERMLEISRAQEKGESVANKSILEVILAGNYQTFEDQRAYMRSISSQPPRPAAPSLPPKPVRLDRSKHHRGPPRNHGGRW